MSKLRKPVALQAEVSDLAISLWLAMRKEPGKTDRWFELVFALSHELGLPPWGRSTDFHDELAAEAKRRPHVEPFTEPESWC